MRQWFAGQIRGSQTLTLGHRYVAWSGHHSVSYQM